MEQKQRKSELNILRFFADYAAPFRWDVCGSGIDPRRTC